MEVIMKTNNIKNNLGENDFLVNLESFTGQLKKEDERNLQLSKAFFWIYLGFIGLYSILIVVSMFYHRGFYRLFSEIFFILTFVSFIFIFRYNLKIFKNIDYSLPLAEMLKGVVKRYQLRLNYLSVLLAPILLLDAGLTLTFYEDLLPVSPLDRVLMVQVFYVPVMLFSTLIGVLIWRRNQKPLRDRAIELLKELEG